MTAGDGPRVTPDQARALRRLTEQTASDPPADLASRVRDVLRVDLSTEFAGRDVPHPFGKASGQLSCTPAQVRDDVAAGIAFVVLKTVIAESPSSERSMSAWARPETRMRVERRASRAGREGWTVTWEGRGWHGTLGSYVELCHAAWEIGFERGVPVIPSVKYHLPPDGDYRRDEYQHTTRTLAEAWARHWGDAPLWVEKDFSPTLAGDPLADDRDRIFQWVRDVPGLIAGAIDHPVRVGLKLMNALFDEAFQVEMLAGVGAARPTPAYVVAFNRLYDVERGVAFGGWDLSERNLAVLRVAQAQGLPLPPLSGTGNICSGRVMLDYALAGCRTGQVHTFFQVPRAEYLARGGGRTARALHTLLLHPEDGLVPWLWHLADAGRIEPVAGELRFRDAVGAGGTT